MVELEWARRYARQDLDTRSGSTSQRNLNLDDDEMEEYDWSIRRIRQDLNEVNHVE
jgi:hypothetical protein